MKISIRVNKGNLPAVKTALKEYDTILEAHKKDSDFNDNRKITLSNDVLTYEGERDFLASDNTYDAYVFGIAVHGKPLSKNSITNLFRGQIDRGKPFYVEVIEYITSEPSVNWWETLEGAMGKLKLAPFLTPKQVEFIKRHLPNTEDDLVITDQGLLLVNNGKSYLNINEVALYVALRHKLVKLSFS
jgi:hypothetical protein